MKLVGYCRVSTDNQKEEGTIGLQRNALRDYAKRGGHELVEVFEDEGVSGGMEDRPGLAGLFAYVEENGDVDGVLIYKLDRLARDLYIQEHLIKQLEKLDKKLVSCKEPDLESGDPMRKAFRQFMGIVAELEKAYITMRLSGGRIEKAKRGKYAGGRTAYGYSAKDKELCVDQERAEVIREIFKMRRRRKSLREIATDLNERNVPTANGGKWYAGTVRYILKNKLYKGVLDYSSVKTKREDLAIM